jgi:hypothetical protein
MKLSQLYTAAQNIELSAQASDWQLADSRVTSKRY